MAPTHDLGLNRYELVNLADGSILLTRWLRQEDADRYNRLWTAADVGTHWRLSEESALLATA